MNMVNPETRPVSTVGVGGHDTRAKCLGGLLSFIG